MQMGLVRFPNWFEAIAPCKFMQILFLGCSQSMQCGRNSYIVGDNEYCIKAAVFLNSSTQQGNVCGMVTMKTRRWWCHWVTWEFWDGLNEWNCLLGQKRWCVCLAHSWRKPASPPCIENRHIEDNFIFYIEYRFFFVPVVKLRWEYNILSYF